MLTNSSSFIATPDALIDVGVTRGTFATQFEEHYGKTFDTHDAHDLMIAEGVFSKAFDELGDDGVVC